MLWVLTMMFACGGNDTPEAQEPPPPPLPSEVTASTSALPHLGGPFPGPYTATSSSALREKSGMVHRPARITDRANKTAWCEGLPGDGLGEWVEISARCNDTQKMSFTGLGVIAGYASKESTFKKNNRVSSAKVTIQVNGEVKRTATIHLADQMKEQLADLGDMPCPAGGQITARLEIAGVTAGTKYKDTCLSEMTLYAAGQAQGSAALDADMVRGRSSCRTKGWSTDGDPAGLNVRAGPGTEHRVVGRLTGREFAPVFDIVESENGWLRIKNASISHPDRGTIKINSPKEGWVSGSLVGIGVRGGEVTLRKRPKKSSEGFYMEGGHDLQVKKVVACSGGWLKVKGVYEGQKASGWLAGDDQCLSQVTICN